MLPVQAVRYRYGPKTVAILTDPGGSVLRRAHPPPSRRGRWRLRSSPTPEGRCCGQDAPGVGEGLSRVAILTDPGGSVLRSTPTTTCRASSSCDPHRPRRVGAALSVGIVTATPIMLRSSPTPEGRCCAAGLVSEMHDRRLRSSPTPEGRCCRIVCGSRSSSHAVAILTDPGGSVLPSRAAFSLSSARTLRSSPTPEGRCCLQARMARCRPAPGCDPHRPRRVGAARARPLGDRHRRGAVLLRSSPTPEGRCCAGRPRTAGASPPDSCDPHRPRRVGAAHPRHPQGARPAGCDPHRPRRVGAAWNPGMPIALAHMALRSSPTPEGRCCDGGHQPHLGAGLGVAILTDPGGSVLPVSTTPESGPRIDG